MSDDEHGKGTRLQVETEPGTFVDVEECRIVGGTPEPELLQVESVRIELHVAVMLPTDREISKEEAALLARNAHALGCAVASEGVRLVSGMDRGEGGRREQT